jgi:mycofactocin precursor peptide peptidase
LWCSRGNRDERAVNFDRRMNGPEKICFEGSTIGARQVNSSYHQPVPVLGELGAATSSQLSSISPSILVPLGSTEQHGPHLPLDTDTRIATAVARGAVLGLRTRLGREWLVAPAIAYGASGEHQDFAGTISIGTEALTNLLVEYGRSAACWAQRLVFVNGHGGNVGALSGAVRQLRAEGRDVGWCPCVAAGGDAHAGHTETSVLLHISPADVLTDRWLAGNRAPLPELLPSMRRGGVAAVSRVGVLGDPTTATAAEGKRIFAEMVDECVRRVVRWLPERDGMLT